LRIDDVIAAGSDSSKPSGMPPRGMPEDM